MADNPLKRLARLLGGVALTQGRLPHQVLGQMMITDATALEVAGANVVVAATARQRGAMAQMAVRTAAPALAVQGLAVRQEKRLRRLAELVQARQRKAGETLARVRAEQTGFDAGIEDLRRMQAQLEMRSVHIDEQRTALAAEASAMLARNAELDARARELESRAQEIERLAAGLAQREAAMAERERLLETTVTAPTEDTPPTKTKKRKKSSRRTPRVRPSDDEES